MRPRVAIEILFSVAATVMHHMLKVGYFGTSGKVDPNTPLANRAMYNPARSQPKRQFLGIWFPTPGNLQFEICLALLATAAC